MGVSRRELLKRSAAAGGVIWAAPLVRSTAAWAAALDYCGAACYSCGDGRAVYAKFAPGNSCTVDNQCLAPNNAIKCVAFSCLEQALLVTDAVASNNNTGHIVFDSSRVRIIRLAMKNANAAIDLSLVDPGSGAGATTKAGCVMVTCVEGFSRAFNFEPSDNTGPDNEPKTSWLKDTSPNPLFKFNNGTSSSNTDYTPGPGGDPGTGGTCGPITRVDYDSNALGVTLNYIEMLLCIRNVSTIACLQ